MLQTHTYFQDSAFAGGASTSIQDIFLSSTSLTGCSRRLHFQELNTVSHIARLYQGHYNEHQLSEDWGWREGSAVNYLQHDFEQSVDPA